jgi:hypothetical protein
MRSRVVSSAVVTAALCLASIPVAAFTSAVQPLAKAVVSDVAPAKDAPARRHYSQARASRFSHQPRVPRHLRGFADPGYAYHGNINGCVIDQGYGRYAPCDSGR